MAQMLDHGEKGTGLWADFEHEGRTLSVVWACDDSGPQREADVYTLDDGELDDCFTSFGTWDHGHGRPSVAWLATDLVNAACEHLEAIGR